MLCFLIILIGTGCKMEKKQTSKIEKKEKAPSSLSEISQGLQDLLKDVEEIEKILDGTSIEQKESQMKEEEAAKQEKAKEGKDEEDTKSKDEEKEQKDKPENSNKDNKLIEVWINIDKKIEEIHNKWNLYEVEGIKKGIDVNGREELEEALNSLTKSIEERNIVNIYYHGSESMLQLSPIFNIYKDEIKGNINKIKSFVYQSYLKAIEGRRRDAENLLKDLGEDINQIRVKIEEEEEKIKILDKTNLSIEDMKKSLNENSIQLYRIKKDIIIKNLDELGE